MDGVRWVRNHSAPVSSGILAAASDEWRFSGGESESRALRPVVSGAVVGEGRLALPVIGAGGVGRLKIVPGATTGLAFQIAFPEADQLYVQVSPGVDAYWMEIGDPAYTTFSQDAQIRPILLVELGLPTQDGFPFFLRYGFYPTPGITSRWIFSMGSYFRL